MRRARVTAAVLAASAIVSAPGAASSAAGGRPVAAVSHPIDAQQQLRVAFGERSHWLQPWRAYLDTVPATQLLDATGIDFDVPPARARAVARLLARTGFRRARIEVGWGSFSYARPNALKRPRALATTLLALRDAHIRPLILLNANDLEPCPLRQFQARLVEPAAAGATSVQVDDRTASAIVPGRSGLTLPPDDKAAGVLFTSVRDGMATLSKPLPMPLGIGDHAAATLLYQPFAHPRSADGRPDPRFERTLSGWLRYVAAVVRIARQTLGSTQFDVEVWNELSFDSDFLDLDSYYAGAADHGSGSTTDAILRGTVSMLRRPGNGLDGVGIGDGFASQRPWDSGATVPNGLTAIDKHPYAPPKDFPSAAVFGNVRPVDATGRVDAERVAGTWRDRFVPRYRAFLPEYALTAIQTESLVRDLSPYTTRIYGVPHGRFTHPSGGTPPQVWVTEWNLDPGDALPGGTAGPLDAVERHVQAKAALRALVAFVNKGVRAFFYYSAFDPRLGLIDPRARDGGETIDAMGRLLGSFAGARPLREVRPLRLLRIGAFDERAQFAGDGTTAHPPLYDRDVVAFLPFQLTDNRYVVAAYVMTRDIGHRYRSTSSRVGGEYDMPPELFRLTFAGFPACATHVSMTDPLLGGQPPVRVVGCRHGTFTVDVRLTDSPRLLQLG